MIRTFIPGVITILVAVCFSSSAVGDEKIRAKFLSEGPKGWTAIETFFQKVEGKVIDTLEPLAGFPDDGKDYGHRAIHEFKIAGENVLHTVQTLRALEVRGQPVSTDVINVNYAFLLNRKSEQSPWTIRHVGSKDRVQYAIKHTGQVLLMSVNIFQQPLPWTASQPGFSLNDAREVGDGLVEINFSSSDVFRKNYYIISGGRVQLDPNHHWCVCEYLLDVQLHDEKGVIEGKIEYGREENGFLFPRKITQDFSFDSGVRKRRTFDFERYRSAEVPDNEFTLTAFDLPEPDLFAKPRFPTTLVALNVFAIVALMVGIYLRRKGKAM